MLPNHATHHNFESQECIWSQIWFIMTFYYKMRQILLQDATAILLQNATKVYYKNTSGFLLQNATVLL